MFELDASVYIYMGWLPWSWRTEPVFRWGTRPSRSPTACRAEASRSFTGEPGFIVH